MINRAQDVIKSAIDCLDNAATIADTAQIPSDLTEKLGAALCRLSGAEEERPGIFDPIDHLLTACDRLYVSFFDQVVIPGEVYRISSEQDEGVRYIKTEDLRSFWQLVQALKTRIVSNPEIFGGKPIIRGRRLAVEHVLGMLNAGDSIETLLEEYPWLEPEDIQACLI